MALRQLKCPACGADRLESRVVNGENVYHCGFCGIEFIDQVGLREYEKLEATIKAGLGSVVDDTLLRERMNTYYNLRSLLFGKITANYIDSAAIVGICRDLKGKSNDRTFSKGFLDRTNEGNGQWEAVERG